MTWPLCFAQLLVWVCDCCVDVRSTGWLTSWGEGMANTSFLPPASSHSADPAHDPKYFIGALNAILRYRNNSGNVNFYMAAGGTNFGWWQGMAALLRCCLGMPPSASTAGGP